MKKIILIGLSLISISVNANNLNQLINVHSKQTILSLNKESARQSYNDDSDSAYRYKMVSKIIKPADLNKDGINDQIVLMNYCERSNCHPTTSSTEIAVFIGTKSGNYKYSDSISFNIGANITSIQPNGRINLIVDGYGDNDPSCCPSAKSKRSYTFNQGKLVRLK